jgi:hypothetical protein
MATALPLVFQLNHSGSTLTAEEIMTATFSETAIWSIFSTDAGKESPAQSRVGARVSGGNAAKRRARL